MAKVYYEYQKSLIVEDEVDVPDDVIARGDRAIRNYIMETVWNDDYDKSCGGEDETVTYTIAEDQP